MLAPPTLEAPLVTSHSEKTAVIQFRPASDEHGFISHYLVIVVPDHVGREKSPTDIDMKEVMVVVVVVVVVWHLFEMLGP